MTSQTYNFSTPSDYVGRQLFLDPAGPVTVQRFDSVSHPRVQKFERLARGFFWTPEEVTLTQDKIDFKSASDIVKHIFTWTLVRQTALDSLQGRGPNQVFSPCVSVPELEALLSNWSFFETNIHSVSYSHIIENVYGMPKKQFDALHDSKPIVEMAASIGKYYDDLHLLNCKKTCGIPVSEHEHIKAIWLALHASMGLESIRFLTSFSVSLLWVESKMFMGNGNIISLILQDEFLHAEWTAHLINQVAKEDPRFAAMKIECEDEVYAIYQDIIREEKEWADFLFSKGVVVGMNAEILKDFIDYNATIRLKDVGIKYIDNPIKTNPIPWFTKHSNPSGKQSALQETENTSYLVAALSADIDLDKLPVL
jgi:ribonucleoside-diphosphate reductase beta chain